MVENNLEKEKEQKVVKQPSATVMSAVPAAAPEEPKKWKVQHRWDTAENWRTLNPLLLAGEKGIVSDSDPKKREYRVGDGTNRWNDLPASFDWDGEMPAPTPGGKVPTKLSELEADAQSQHFTLKEKNKLESLVPGEGGKPSVATNYGDLAGKPQIGGHEIKSGNQSAESLNLASLDMIVVKSKNVFDASLQTDDTISPHYYVNGEPYTTTQFDNSYNCTALFPLKPSTQYTIAIVPEYGHTKPWGKASFGIFFYDNEGKYINGSTDNTFITPPNTVSARFNYILSEGITLSIVQKRCMIVEGNEIPLDFEPFLVKNRIDDLEENVNLLKGQKGFQYLISDDSIKVAYPYSRGKDILIELKKKGGNNLFDFYGFWNFEHGKILSSLQDSDITLIQTTTTDWHAPFVVKAVNNINGDLPDSEHFTGGNHEYTNTGNGGSPTAKGVALQFLIDGVERQNGSGYCCKVEIYWINDVQATNTKKIDGTGRVVLTEYHHILFDGNKFYTDVKIIPKENIQVERWYGFQTAFNKTLYPNVQYVGGEKKNEFKSDVYSESGGNKANEVIIYGAQHKMILEIDISYDLGSRYLMTQKSASFFTQSYGKSYANVILSNTLQQGCAYYLRGAYEFKPNYSN